MTVMVLGIGLKSCVNLKDALWNYSICISEVRAIQFCKVESKVLKNFGAPLTTKFTYKKRLGGN
jgi:hypothetical protein